MPDITKVVLLVDDDAIVRKALMRLLRTCGADIREAVNGEEALTLLREGLRPAIIISDIDMPAMNGLVLARHVKAEFPTLQLVLCSGGGHERAASELGVEYYPKPTDPSTLRELVKNAL